MLNRLPNSPEDRFMDSISAAGAGPEMLMQQVATRVLVKQHEVASKQGEAAVALLESAKQIGDQIQRAQPGRLDVQA